ncbi:uncharacterized protein EV422DRAFT_408557 [Fimicolochytrium jonesii]|uniref:uncharacterized protein n=1 Tax=Fimicolochytrium jonesii TaxID=1396493 RepID=UPI0022FEEB61|nr:uncharacterized protein EV422DRAFT_408557 [Fimicolochytrium jonesii]KAI8822648.1 hypothetical protein EV422DRAFT_408557 [Fimicolochytrium jonesii]
MFTTRSSSEGNAEVPSFGKAYAGTAAGPGMPPGRRLAAVDDVVLRIFHHLQPSCSNAQPGPRISPVEHPPAYSPVSHLPFERHLGAVCRRWRLLAFSLRSGDVLSLHHLLRDNTARPISDEKHAAGLRLFVKDKFRQQSLQHLVMTQFGGLVRAGRLDLATDIFAFVKVPRNLLYLFLDFQEDFPSNIEPLLDWLTVTPSSTSIPDVNLQQSTVQPDRSGIRHLHVNGTITSNRVNGELVKAFKFLREQADVRQLTFGIHRLEGQMLAMTMANLPLVRHLRILVMESTYRFLDAQSAPNLNKLEAFSLDRAPKNSLAGLHRLRSLDAYLGFSEPLSGFSEELISLPDACVAEHLKVLRLSHQSYVPAHDFTRFTALQHLRISGHIRMSSLTCMIPTLTTAANLKVLELTCISPVRADWAELEELGAMTPEWYSTEQALRVFPQLRSLKRLIMVLYWGADRVENRCLSQAEDDGQEYCGLGNGNPCPCSDDIEWVREIRRNENARVNDLTYHFQDIDGLEAYESPCVPYNCEELQKAMPWCAVQVYMSGVEVDQGFFH